MSKGIYLTEEDKLLIMTALDFLRTSSIINTSNPKYVLATDQRIEHIREQLYGLEEEQQ